MNDPLFPETKTAPPSAAPAPAPLGVVEGSTIVQKTDPVTGVVTQTVVPPGEDPLAPIVGVADKMEAEVIQAASVATATGGIVQEVETSATHDFANAKASANALFTTLHNAAGHDTLNPSALYQLMGELNGFMHALLSKL